LGRPTEAALARERLAEALMFLGRDDEALRALDRAVAVYRASGDLDGEARVAATMGWVCSGRGTPLEGLSCLEPLLGPPARDGLSAQGLAALRTAQAQLYYCCGRYSEQLAVAEHAVELARAIGDELMLTNAESRRGLALVALGRTEEAIPALEETRRLAERHGDLECLKEAIFNLGWIYDTRGEFNLSRRYGERALEIVERLGHQAGVAFALFRCSLTAFLSGDWEYARAAIKRASAIERTLGSPMISMYILTGLGLLRQAEGQWQVATQALEEVIARARSSGDLQNLRAAQSALAERDLMEGRPDVARGRLEPLLDQPDHQETDVTLFLPRLAWARLDLGAMPEAEALVEQSIARAAASRNRVALLDALRVRALVATRQARWDEAESSLEEALALAQAMPCPYSDAKVFYVYGLLHLAKGGPRQARERWEKGRAICGRLGERLFAEHIERALATLEG
jgi:tetratricopeptide (TPR) repeat protein